MSIKVLYIGKDLGYFQSLQANFKHYYGAEDIEYLSDSNIEKMDSIQKFIEIALDPPQILYIDMSKEKEKMFCLLKLLRKENVTKLISTTCLFDYLAPKDELARAIMYGSRLNQVKSAEITDVVFDAMVFKDPETAVGKEYSLARFSADGTMDIDLRLAYVAPDHFLVETNIPFKQGQYLEIKEHCLKHLMTSKNFDVSEISETNLYFNTRFGIKLNFHYLAGHSEEDIAAGLNSSDGKIKSEAKAKKKALEEVKNEIQSWIENKKNLVSPKTTKVLIVDKKLDLLKSVGKKITDYPYSINIQTKLIAGHLQVKRMRPHIIAFVYEPPPQAGDPSIKIPEKFDPLDYNGGEMLEGLCINIKKMDNYDPIIVVFNAKHKSETLQNRLGHKKIISDPRPPDMKLILKLASAFEDSAKLAERKSLQDQHAQLKAKDPRKANSLRPEDLRPLRSFFKSSDLSTLIKTEFPIQFVAMTESEIFFKCNLEIPPYTVLEFTTPVQCHVTVVPMKPTHEFSKDPTILRGLVNFMGELEKQKIRQFINGIFFTELNEKKAKELEEFKEKQAAALTKMREEEAKKLAEQDAATASDEEEKKAS